jgi:hypothetical protein
MTTTLIIAGTVFATVAILALAALRGWRDWLAFKRLEFDGRGRARDDDRHAEVAVRIELAVVRERLKRLEGIANGVEL